VTEAFLAEHLGGRYEPIGDAFEGSSITVPAGENGVPGLPPILKVLREKAAAEEEEERKKVEAAKMKKRNELPKESSK
jgi:hypothetical protein